MAWNDFQFFRPYLLLAVLALTYDEIIGTVVSFFAAGFETTASTMTYTLYELALNQDYQDQVRSEIKEALAANNDKVTYEIAQNVKYLDWAISGKFEISQLLLPI